MVSVGHRVKQFQMMWAIGERDLHYACLQGEPTMAKSGVEIDWKSALKMPALVAAARTNCQPFSPSHWRFLSVHYFGMVDAGCIYVETTKDAKFVPVQSGRANVVFAPITPV